ncbi:hypothetical protein HDU76_008656, partial [Blyttiomyces sp. JEL0837]
MPHQQRPTTSSDTLPVITVNSPPTIDPLIHNQQNDNDNDDDDAELADERSPMLPAGEGESDDQSTLNRSVLKLKQSLINPFATKGDPIQTVVIVAASIVIIISSLVAWMYMIYIPMRLQKGSGEGSNILNSLHISSINEFNITLTVNATQTVSEPPPVDIVLSSSLFTLTTLGDIQPPKREMLTVLKPYNIPSSWEKEDRKNGINPTVVASVDFPGLITPPGAETVSVLLTNATMDIWETEDLADMITYLVSDAIAPSAPKSWTENERKNRRYQNGLTFRQESKPLMKIPAVHGSWIIPMWKYFRYDAPSLNDTGNGNDTVTDPSSGLDFTIDDQSIDFETVVKPNGEIAQIYVLNAVASFTNEAPVTVEDLHISFHASLFRDGVRMATVSVMLPGGVLKGRNSRRIKIKGKSDPDGTIALMNWIGEYAEGVDTEIQLREFALGYVDGRDKVSGGRLQWVEKMLKKWDFTVIVPGAKEDGMMKSWVR